MHVAIDFVRRTGRLRPAPGTRAFVAWIAAFYLAWLALVEVGGLWPTVAAHWPIALAMALGSYFAGSTPMGGGTLGFPVLVLLLGEDAALGRDFSFAVQSVGMVSASILILARRRPVEWVLLKWTLVGALAATPTGLAWVSGVVPETWMKLLFAVIWCSFGILHFVKLREIVAARGITPTTTFDREIGLAIGLTGGVVSSIVGVGIDMLLYAVLVLLYRADLKVAIPTSVIAMAFTSVVGVASSAALGTLRPEVFGHWIAAAPVVAVGAPFGVLVVQRLPRAPTLVIVSTLCVAQYGWMLTRTRPAGAALVAAIAGVLLFNAAFHLLYVHGRVLHRRHGVVGTDALRDPPHGLLEGPGDEPPRAFAAPGEEGSLRPP